MNKIAKNVKILGSTVFLTGLLFADIVKAECKNGQIPDPFHPTCEGTPLTIGDIIGRFLPVIPVALGMVLFAMLIWGGFQIFTSGPNDDAKKKGIQTIQNAIIGVVIILFSVAIITILEAVLGVKILFGVFVK